MLAVVDRYTRILERERERERPAPIAQKPAEARLTMRKRAATIAQTPKLQHNRGKPWHGLTQTRIDPSTRSAIPRDETDRQAHD
jgi:hypothetical protein